jgi:dipeptidyl aminopeptidase/acylaminoacyl peptidase
MERKTMRTLLVSTLIATGAAIAVVQAQATFQGRNGLLVFQAQAGDHVQLFSVRPDGGGVRQLTSFPDSDANQALWSPDGTKIVFLRSWARTRRASTP